MKRRDFIKYTTAGVAGLWVGAKLPPWATTREAFAATATLSLTFTDALKHMVTDNALNPATCYFWILKASTPGLDPESPGPIIFAFEGDTIALNLTNNLPQAHRLAIPALDAAFPASGPFTSPTLAPGDANKAFSFTLPAESAGTYLYYDDLNAPVNRVMGLHGALVVMPVAAKVPPAVPTNPKITPYTNPPPKIQQLFNDLGAAAWWPGLAWEQGAANPPCSCGAAIPNTPPFRQYVWLLHESSPSLFADVGRTTGDFPAATFVDRFLNNPYTPGKKLKAPASPGDTPLFFTVNGQSGHFVSSSPFVVPHLRVGEPCVIRVLNAGLWTHCMHIHANHVYTLRVNGAFNPCPDVSPAVVPAVSDNHLWVDTYSSRPLDVWDWLLPYIRPPDVPNSKGFGRTDLSVTLPVDPTPIDKFGVVRTAAGTLVSGPTPAGVRSWPPTQEVKMAMPPVGSKAGVVPIHVQLSPLCYPMHDHSEPSQVAQGGNYNSGLITGLHFTGDRNTPDPNTGALTNLVTTFPDAPLQFGPDFNVSPQPAAGPLPPFPEVG